MLSVSNSTESLQALQRVPGSGGGPSGGNDIVIVTDKLAARQGKEEGAGPRRRTESQSFSLSPARVLRDITMLHVSC